MDIKRILTYPNRTYAVILIETATALTYPNPN